MAAALAAIRRFLEWLAEDSDQMWNGADPAHIDAENRRREETGRPRVGEPHLMETGRPRAGEPHLMEQSSEPFLSVAGVLWLIVVTLFVLVVLAHLAGQ